MIKELGRVCSSLCGALLFTACVDGAGVDDMEAPDESAEISEKQQGLWIDGGVLWTGGSIDTCWTNPTEMDPSRREAVRRAIAGTWSMAGNIEFTGWGTCTTANQELRISLGDGTFGPRAADIGTLIKGRSTGLTLYDKWTWFHIPEGLPAGMASGGLTCSSTSTPAQLEACAVNTAIHEFGHILGFAHDQNAPTAPTSPGFTPNCTNLVTTNETPGTYLYNNTWDLYSVMNYCNPNYLTGQLSQLDRDGMRATYGFSRRFTAALVAAGVI